VPEAAPAANAPRQTGRETAAAPQPVPPPPKRSTTETALRKAKPQQAAEPQQKAAVTAAPDASDPAMPSPDTKQAPERGVFSVHVFSFKTQQEAQQEIERLNRQGFSAYLETVDLGAKGVWHRVKVGPYGTRTGAEQARIDIKKKYPGIEPMLHRWR
jgi:cell division septation protein DedD